jgi:hypothetical protein
MESEDWKIKKFNQMLENKKFKKKLIGNWIRTKIITDIPTDKRWTYVIEQKDPSLIFIDMPAYLFAFKRTARRMFPKLFNARKMESLENCLDMCWMDKSFREEMFLCLKEVESKLMGEINQSLLNDIILNP